MRTPKARASNDPAKLTREAERWAGEISKVENRYFIAPLNAHDRTTSWRQAATIRDCPPPPTREIVQQAPFQILEGTKTTGPALFRAAVVLSAGSHEWNDLLAETRAKMARRKKNLSADQGGELRSFSCHCARRDRSRQPDPHRSHGPSGHGGSGYPGCGNHRRESIHRATR